MYGLGGRMEFTEYSQGSRKISSCPAICRQLANKLLKSRSSAPTRELLVMGGIRVLESGAMCLSSKACCSCKCRPSLTCLLTFDHG